MINISGHLSTSWQDYYDRASIDCAVNGTFMRDLTRTVPEHGDFQLPLPLVRALLCLPR